MQPQAHAEFNDIVLKGIRSAKGMQSFADVVSAADAEAIHAYLVARAARTIRSRSPQSPGG